MVQKNKAFDFEIEVEDDVEDLPPITFKLKGEEFEAYGEVPGMVFLDYLENSGDDDVREQVKAMKKYLKSSMDEENHTRLLAILNDPTKPVKMTSIAQIVNKLIEKRASRPTEQPSE